MMPTAFNKLTPHTATWADIKRLLIRTLHYEHWKLTCRPGFFGEVTMLEHCVDKDTNERNRPIAIQLTGIRRGSIWLHGERITPGNGCLAKEARRWCLRHLASDLLGEPCR